MTSRVSCIETYKVETLYKMLPALSPKARIAIYLRFWECMTIQEISKRVGLSWDCTDKLIEKSLLQLRQGFEWKIQTQVSQAA